jgi:1,4-dihydroxy-6-naphthoate synthase
MGTVPTPGVRWKARLEDVEVLNRLALERKLPVTKLSFHAYGHLREAYALLSSGAALGRGCGPLLVSRTGSFLSGGGKKLSASGAKGLAGARIAIPGRWTSAALLLRLYAPGLLPGQLIEMPFHRILESVAKGETDAGLIIHESRFTYAAHGLSSLGDLGSWWEEETGLPIPLGGIFADRRLGRATIAAVEGALRESVLHARRHPEESAEYVRLHAQEMSAEVTRAHIDLYVNDFTVDLGPEGRKAIAALFKMAEAAGIVPAHDGPLGLNDEPRLGYD